MADQDYNKKLESLQRYIPFLVNMMTELKAKGNREAQLTKIQSLHDMITDTKKKLKIETLNRCEEVLTNIYFKVNPQLRTSKTTSKPDSPKSLPGIESPRSTPLSPSPPRDILRTKPVTIPTEKVDTPPSVVVSRSPSKTHRPKIEVYSNVVINTPSKVKPITKVPDMSKPPISLDDLKTLEDDVQQKITDAAFSHRSVDELQEVRKQLQLQLRVDEVTTAMSPEKSTVTSGTFNTPTCSKRLLFTESKSSESSASSRSPIKEIKSPTDDKKRNKEKEDKKSPKKQMKDDADIFGTLLSNIDNKLMEERKKLKTFERRSSKDDSGSTSSLLSDKSDIKETDKKKYREHRDKNSHESSSKYRRSSIDKERSKDRKREENKDKSKYDTKDKARSESKDSKRNDKEKDRHRSKDKDKTHSKSEDMFKDKFSSSSDSKSGSEVDLKSSSNISIADTKDDDSTQKPVAMLKRLADKYNPKPKQKTNDTNTPEVDKSVSDSIEQLMRFSPTKLSPLGQPKPTIGERFSKPGDATTISIPSSGKDLPKPSKLVQLPDILQKIFSKPLLGDIIPKRLTEPIVLSSSSSLVRPPSGVTLMTKPGAIQPPDPSPLSPTRKPLQFKSPAFVSPPRMNSPDMIGRNTPLLTPVSGHGMMPAPLPGHGMMPTPVSAHGMMPSPVSGHGMGILPTPPIPPSLPEFMDHGINMGYGTPRVDFDAPGTPMVNFESPRMDFEPPAFHNQFHLNQQHFGPPMPEHQMHGFDPRPANFMGQGHFPHQPDMNAFNQYDMNQGGPFCGPNQMFLGAPEVPHYMHDQTFYQDRPHWAGDIRPGDPRSYREYKEMKERHEREIRQKDIKDPRLAPRESRDGTVEPARDPRLARDASADSNVKDKSEVAIRDPRLSRGGEKSVERTRDCNDRVPTDPREGARSRDRRTGTLPPWDSRSRGRENRFESSKFDKMYSRTNRGRSQPSSQVTEEKVEGDDSFVSPLDSLYNAGEKGRTGRGYGVQKFRIPRKAKWEQAKQKDKKKKAEKTSSNTQRRRIIDLSDSEESDTNNADGPASDDSDHEVVEGEVDSKLADSEPVKKENVESKDTVKSVEAIKSELNTSRIKVVIKSANDDTSSAWKTDSQSIEALETDEFISEYDREFQEEIKDKNKAVKETSEIQVEEPSSSQDVTDAKDDSSKKIDVSEAGSFRKPSEPVEADSSRKGDGNVTPQAAASKNAEPSEQNILAHFFENLLKSSNKRDKKSALFSLIETFSDSFEDREIQKIRKIINVNENDGEAGDDAKEEVNSVPNAQGSNSAIVLQDEQPVVGSTTEDHGFPEKKETTDVADKQPIASETQVNEVTKSTDKLDQEPSDDLKSDESLEPVMVSVGERIKNRKRVPASKPKKRFKSELDQLHADIQDMFIRDGVLTATGKRMCRILKDEPTTTLASSDQTTPVVEQPKKTRKKPAPKGKVKGTSHEGGQSSMKDMRVVIKKIPDEVLSTTRQLRSRNRQNSYVETDEETQESIADETSFAGSFDAGSDKSDLEAEFANETDEGEGGEGVQKPKVKRRKVPKWASGIIPRSRKKKSQNKSKENSPERLASPASFVAGGDLDVDKLVEPDKDYYYDYLNKRKLQCKLCKYSGHLMTGHYLKEHPQSEVLCSRFPPQVASEAITDFSVNGKTFESIVTTKMNTKYHYCCRMCDYKSFVSPVFFYEHVTTHTGEYRHQCGLCEYFAFTGKTMAGHFIAVHPDQERRAIRRTYTLAVVFGYMCGECNFVQLKEKSVEDHANIFHLGEKPVIYKINMSSILDPELIKPHSSEDGLKAIELKSKDNSYNESDTVLEEIINRKKPGPKPKPKEKLAEDETTTLRKKPGPKSKTLPIGEKEITGIVDNPLIDPNSSTLPGGENEAPKLTEEVVDTPPVRRKPGPKSKTQKSKPVPQSAKGENQEETTASQTELAPPPTIMNEDAHAKEVPARKRRRSLDKLISEDSGDDLDTIITLSSRSSRAAKEKATAKLKTLMESNEGMTVKKKTDSEPNKKDKEVDAEKVSDQNRIDDGKTQEEKETEICPPAAKDQAVPSKDKDLNVFTCKSDILQEDAKKIQEERLRKMDELNKSIVARPSNLDFINKLSDRLSNEQQSKEKPPFKIKEEPKDDDVRGAPPARPETPAMPHLEPQTPDPISRTQPVTASKTPIASKKPAFEEQPDVQQPSIQFRQNKPNSLFSNMIEKLQGKVNEAAVQDESSSTEPSVEGTVSNDNRTSSLEDRDNEVFISIGDLIRATKSDKEIIYSCHTNGCYVATKDKMVFQLHCKFGHKELNLKSSLCEKCGVVVDVTQDTTLLENLYDHLVYAHSDFLSKSSTLRMRRLSGDKLSIKQEKGDSPPPPSQAPEDFETGIDRYVLKRFPEAGEQSTADGQPMETQPSAPTNSAAVNTEPAASQATLELAEDNPFSFKIASVMSLAESNESQASKEPGTKPASQLPPLTLIPKQQTSSRQSLIIKESKLTTAELTRPKKAPKALQKFIDCPGDLYKCPHHYCVFTTNVRAMLTCHLKVHRLDSPPMVPCVYCDVKTPWEHVPMHIDIRHSNSNYSCSYCLYRAAMTEYVCLHQEIQHPNCEFVVLSLPPHKAAKKFAIADSKTDYKALCEPFRCCCNDKDDDEAAIREYLFETEFVHHLSTAHANQYKMCGYPNCGHMVNTSMMLNHWSSFHGVCTYQCGYCKTSSKEIVKMYSHFAQQHPNKTPDILVRKNDFLPQDVELGFSNDAFQQLGHIRKIPSTLLKTIGKRAQRSIKLIQINVAPSGTSEEPNNALAPTRLENINTGTPGASLLVKPVSTLLKVPAPQARQLVLTNNNLKLIVASTSGNSPDKLYLVPASMVSPTRVQSVTSVAPINKAIVQTSTASKSLLAGGSLVSKEPVKIGNITLYPSDESEVAVPVTTSSQVPSVTAPPPSHSTIAMLSQSLVTTTLPLTLSAKSDAPVFTTASLTAAVNTMPSEQSICTNIGPSLSSEGAKERGPPEQLFQDDENDSRPVSEDDMLQSAIQSILDHDDDSTNSSTRLESTSNNIRTTPAVSRPGTPSPLLSSTVPDLPPLAPICNVPTAPVAPDPPLPSEKANVEVQNEETPEVVAPVEHVDVAGNGLEGSLAPEEEDPLNLESNEEFNMALPFIEGSDALDPLSEDPLTIASDFNLDLASGDPLGMDESDAFKDPFGVDVETTEQSAVQPVEAEAGPIPMKITDMQRSASMVSTSDDESDSSTSEKRKRGLIGYQLFRCAVCNLSFSNVGPFKMHISSSPVCKKTGVKAFQCVHCEKGLTTPQRLADHILAHGIQRFSCTLCDEKFTTVGIAKLHMKNRHSIHQINLVALKSDRNNMETDDFVIKPCQSNPPTAKDKEPVPESPKAVVDGSSYTPDQIETIPFRQIFSSNVKCGLCNYQTKVRVNIIRHLQMHLDEKAVPDIAPVNPVPCLEKNEKMFDKMFNLAASSITTTGGRMGGTSKEKEKQEEKHPEFIPTHRRFVCCADGCSYLCPEEANLKHHLMALHSDESDFTCAHCKIKIEPAEIESVIKHFKLHGLHLYKCHYCSFVHHLKHKIEKHVSDGHLNVAVIVDTIRYMESEPQDLTPQEEPVTPQPFTFSKFKPWNCCMCKAKYYTKIEVQSHITKKHNIDTQYKCPLCAFKNDEEASCREHFKEKHPNNEFDIILVYQKMEEEAPKDDANAPFDTTPLWQRDKPRVRHIRGILFDESSPQPTKSLKKPRTYSGAASKASGASTPKAAPSTPTETTPKAAFGGTSPSKVGPNTSASATSKTKPSSSPSTTTRQDTVNKNLFDCIDAVARGTADSLKDKPGFSGLSNSKKPTALNSTILQKNSAESKIQPVQKNESPKKIIKNDSIKSDVAVDDTGNDDVLLVPQIPNVIVIDSDESDTENIPKTEETKLADDDTPKTKDKDSKTKPVAKNRALKRQSTTDLLHEAVKMAKIEENEDDDYDMVTNCSKLSLRNMFGGFGTPHNKQWKCPKCNQFKSKRVTDFMFHLYKDFNTYRFRCKVCSDLSITYKYMQDHIKLHSGSNEDIIEVLPPNVKLDTWIHMVITEQSLMILKNAPLFKKRPLTAPTDIMCYFCNEKFMSMPECCEHMLYHWVMMPYQCQHCPHEFYTIYDLRHHHKIEHPDARLYSEPKGPTLARAIQCVENPKKRTPKSPQEIVPKKKPRLEDSHGNIKANEEVSSGKVVNISKPKENATGSVTSPEEVINVEDDDDDLVIVSKTDSQVPNEDDVYACDICVYTADSEIPVVKHLHDKHGIKTNKYHILSKSKAESEAAPRLACNICDEVLSELKLRRHFIENHLGSHIYSPYKWKCGFCSACFLTPSRMKWHCTKVHAGQKPNYQCVVPGAKGTAADKKAKCKQFTCSLCPYTNIASHTGGIRSHLKGHLKPILCNRCNMRFKYQGDIQPHTQKEHAGLVASYSILDAVNKEFTDNMKIIHQNAKIVSGGPETAALEPDTEADNPLKGMAKKSTSTPFLPVKAISDDEEEGYSYYGVPQEVFDLTKISTTFDVDDLEYTMSAQQMLKMFNMDTYVDMSDCLVDIMPLDKS